MLNVVERKTCSDPLDVCMEQGKGQDVLTGAKAFLDKLHLAQYFAGGEKLDLPHWVSAWSKGKRRK